MQELGLWDGQEKVEVGWFALGFRCGFFLLYIKVLRKVKWKLSRVSRFEVW